VITHSNIFAFTDLQQLQLERELTSRTTTTRR
jgi:hypothetical protein